MQKKNLPIKILLIRGLESINDTISDDMGKALGADTFRSDWYNEKEQLSDKLERLDREIQKAKILGQEVIIIGVSAGAGLTLTYMLHHPDTISTLYSLVGVLDPDIHDPKIIKLNNTSKSFKEMTTYLYHELTPDVVRSHHLDTNIIAYGTLGDTVLPMETELPPWVKTQKIVGNQNHVETVAEIVLLALSKRTNLLPKIGKK